MLTSIRRPSVLAAALLVAAGALTGCGQSQSTALPAGAAVVVVQHMRFNPPTVTVSPGQTVVWKFDDLHVAHDVVSQPGGPLHSNLQQAGSYRHTFQEPGTYRYVCTLHLADGMIGDVIVR